MIIPILISGCGRFGRYSYSRIAQEYQELDLSDAASKKESYTALAEIFEKIGKGSASETEKLAELVREITDGSVSFPDEEVFQLAQDYAQLFSELAAGAEDGLQDLEVTDGAGSATELKIGYLGEVRYSVRMVESGGTWYHGDQKVPYGGELGNYLLEIAFYDTEPCSKFVEGYPHRAIHQIGKLSNGGALSLMGELTSDHGYMLYVGCDSPFSVEEQDHVTLGRPIGSVSVKLTGTGDGPA